MTVKPEEHLKRNLIKLLIKLGYEQVTIKGEADNEFQVTGQVTIENSFKTTIIPPFFCKRFCCLI